MDAQKHFESISMELDALKGRVRNFINNRHWLTDGEWKESVLRSMIERRLPDSVKIGRGFILTESGPTTQCDILLYRSDAPLLFRDGDLVFLTPDAAIGVIEVKSRLDRITYGDAIRKLGDIGRKLGVHSDHCFIGLFSYDVEGDPEKWATNALKENCGNGLPKVHFITLGSSHFLRWWERSPDGHTKAYRRWHFYRVNDLSPGYFIANVIDSVCSGKVSRNAPFWFPKDGKENFIITRIDP